jgi:hypothetical protein
MAIGAYNVHLGGSTTTWQAGDPLFQIGNGTSVTASDAMTVLKSGFTGLSQTTPATTLEINSGLGSASGSRLIGGLRFTQLTNASPQEIASYGSVLTVDPNGEIGLTQDAGYNVFGYGDCAGIAPVTLSSDIGMDITNYHIYYDGNTYTGNPLDMTSSIGLGYTCNSTLPGKLSVDQSYTGGNVDVPTVAGYFHNGDVTGTASSPFDKRGVYAINDGLFSNSHGGGWILTNVGGDFEATNADVYNIAVRGRTGINPSASTYGLSGVGGWFDASNSTANNIGVYAYSGGLGSVSNYGIYAYAPLGTCIGAGCSDAAGYFNGDVFGINAYIASDSILKDNVQPLHNSMSVLNQLQPRSYTFRTQQFPSLNLPANTQDGLIAQEVESVLPGLVKNFVQPSPLDSTGAVNALIAPFDFKAVNYVALIPYLIGGIKEQQQILDSMRMAIQQMQVQLDNCCHAGERRRGGDEGNNSGDNTNKKNEERTSVNVQLSNANTIILDQNTPNPFKEETFINYTVPTEVLKAAIMIFDNTSRVLKTVVINERGNGTLHIYAENLSSGTYSYSLIADGKTIDTKKMVCQK